MEICLQIWLIDGDVDADLDGATNSEVDDATVGGDAGLGENNSSFEGADLVADSDADNDPDSDADLQDDPDKPSRKSVRFSRAPKVFTYNEIGGPPVLIDLKSKR